MSINRALPSTRADVAAIYAAPDHAALRAQYERLIGDWSEDELSDLQHPESLRDHLLDYMRELCHSSCTHALDAGIRPEVLPLYLHWHEHYPAMREADFLLANGWWDVSDNDNACPCFESIDRTQRMWIQHPVADVREPAGAPMFSLFSVDENGESTPICSSNEWAEVVPRLVLPDSYTPPAISVSEVLEERTAAQEAIAAADAQLRNLGLPTYTELLAALQAMQECAASMVEAFGMDGADTMTDEHHAKWQDAAGTTNYIISKVSCA